MKYKNEETSGEEEGSYNIPNEIVLKLFGYLDLPDLLKAGCVCKGWYALHNDGYLWKKLYLDSFLHYGFVSIPDQGDDILAKDQQMKRLQELRELELRQHETTQAIGFFKQILQHGYLLLNRWRNGTFSSCELVLFPDKEPSTSTIAWEEEEEEDGIALSLDLNDTHILVGVDDDERGIVVHIYSLAEEQADQNRNVVVKYRGHTNKPILKQLRYLKLVDTVSFVAVGDEHIYIFNLTNGKLIRLIDLTKSLEYLSLAQNLRCSLSIGDEGNKAVFFTVKNLLGKADLATGKVTLSKRENPLSVLNPPYTCSIIPFRENLFITGYFGYFTVWDATTMTDIAKAEPSKKDWCYYFAFTPQYIISGSDHSEITVFEWNPTTRTLSEVLVWHVSAAVVSIFYHCHHIVCHTADSAIKIWHGTTLEHVITISPDTPLVHFTVHPLFPIMLGQTDQFLHMWDMSGEEVESTTFTRPAGTPFIIDIRWMLFAQGNSVFLYDFGRVPLEPKRVTLKRAVEEQGITSTCSLA